MAKNETTVKEQEAVSGDAPLTTAEDASADIPEFQTAVRVETFNVGELWGWRSVTETGAQVRASELEFDSQKAAIKAAQEVDHNDGLTFIDTEPLSANQFTL
jgi:hypothetical protein